MPPIAHRNNNGYDDHTQRKYHGGNPGIKAHIFSPVLHCGLRNHNDTQSIAPTMNSLTYVRIIIYQRKRPTKL